MLFCVLWLQQTYSIQNTLYIDVCVVHVLLRVRAHFRNLIQLLSCHKDVACKCNENPLVVKCSEALEEHSKCCATPTDTDMHISFRT